MDVAEVLERAADLIEPEGAWTQDAYARNAAGDILIIGTDPSAVCWCLVGSLDVAATDGDLWQRAMRIIGSVIDRPGTNGIVGSWNDAPERTQAEVVAKLREAAQLARHSNAG